MNVPLRLLIVGVGIFAVGCHRIPANLSPSGLQRKVAREAVARLLDSSQRDSAFCRLLALRLYHTRPPYPEYPESGCDAVNYVAISQQLDGGAMYIVFHGEAHPEDKIGPGEAHGAFTLFDKDGFIVPAFAGANSFGRDDVLISPGGDGQLAVVETFGYAGGNAFGADGWAVQVLHIVPVTPVQRPALAVVLGPATYGFDDECRGFYWWWRFRAGGGAEPSVVEIGPRMSEDDSIVPRATFRWSATSQRFEGPAGAADVGFQNATRDDECRLWKTAEAFALARRRLAQPGDPSAVRRPTCRSVEVVR